MAGCRAVLMMLVCGLAAALAFVPARPAAMPLQQRQACAVGVQMKALNKPARLAEVRRKYNKGHKSEMRTYIKKTLEAVAAGDYAVAFPLLSKTQSTIDKNVKRGLIHRNTAARKKSQLTLKVKGLEPAAPA